MNSNSVKNTSAANSLQVYLKEIREESLLSAAEECELADAIASGDKDAAYSDDSGQPPAGREDRPGLRWARHGSRRPDW